ncbi:hypothetical protein AAC387_Pa10g1028 [Persea americana]
MGVKIAALIGDEIWEIVLCFDVVMTVGCMWVDHQESWSGGTKGPRIACLEATRSDQPYEFELDVTYGLMENIKTVLKHIAFAACEGREFKQMKVNEAFQHEVVNTGIYLK